MVLYRGILIEINRLFYTKFLLILKSFVCVQSYYDRVWGVENFWEFILWLYIFRIEILLMLKFRILYFYNISWINLNCLSWYSKPITFYFNIYFFNLNLSFLYVSLNILNFFIFDDWSIKFTLVIINIFDLNKRMFWLRNTYTLETC